MFELIILGCSLIGLMSAAHLSTILVRSRFISALDMTKIVTGSIAASLFIIYFASPMKLSMLWFALQAPFAVGIGSTFLLAKRRDFAVEQSLEEMLSQLMMRMKEGRSLSVALELVATEIRAALRPRWIEIARSVSFSPQNSSQVRVLNSLRLIELAREFQRIDNLGRSQLTELERWRARVRTEQSFRRRSVQAMAQVRAQSLILSIIFALLAGFSTIAFGWKATGGPLQLSIPLFFLGLFLIWRGGKRIKWSV